MEIHNEQSRAIPKYPFCIISLSLAMIYINLHQTLIIKKIIIFMSCKNKVHVIISFVRANKV